MEKDKDITTRDLVAFLKKTDVSVKTIDALKIRYRPLICPFDDLLNLLRRDPPQSIFDVGCGSGQFALLLAEFTSARRIFGIEIDERLVNNAKQLFSRFTYPASVEFRRYDGRTFPEELSECDTVFLIDVLHHVPKRRQRLFLEQLYLKMAAGSRLVIKDIDGASPFVVFNKIHDLAFSGEVGNEWSAKEVMSECKNIGFKVESFSKKRLYVYPHFTIVLRK